MGYQLSRLLRLLSGGLVVSAVVLALVGLAAVKRAESIKTTFGPLVGSPASVLAHEFRPPDRVERVAPVVYNNATGSIAARYEPYIVWTYDLLPRLAGNWTMRVIIDDKAETITRFRGPWD